MISDLSGSLKKIAVENQLKVMTPIIEKEQGRTSFAFSFKMDRKNR